MFYWNYWRTTRTKKLFSRGHCVLELFFADKDKQNAITYEKKQIFKLGTSSLNGLYPSSTFSFSFWNLTLFLSRRILVPHSFLLHPINTLWYQWFFFCFSYALKQPRTQCQWRFSVYVDGYLLLITKHTLRNEVGFNVLFSSHLRRIQPKVFSLLSSRL